MIPGFVTPYIDNDGYIHIYFYQGCTDEYKPIFRDVDISNINIEYDVVNNDDGSKDFRFHNKTIIKLRCKLVYNNVINNSIIKVFEIKDQFIRHHDSNTI